MTNLRDTIRHKIHSNSNNNIQYKLWKNIDDHAENFLHAKICTKIWGNMEENIKNNIWNNIIEGIWINITEGI